MIGRESPTRQGCSFRYAGSDGVSDTTVDIHGMKS